MALPARRPNSTSPRSSSNPAVTNTNETLYLMRHTEAHPSPYWEDGNYVAAGQWRALDLPNALSGKISPDQVYSIDPAQITPSWGFRVGLCASVADCGTVCCRE